MIVVRQNLVLQLSKFIIHILKYKIDAIVLFLSASVTILLSIHQRMIFILTGKKKKTTAAAAIPPTKSLTINPKNFS